jgi:hypothetical protein
VAEPPFFYFADPHSPVWEETKAYTDTSVGPEIVSASPRVSPSHGIVTSQTCDIGEEDSERPLKPWVMISPVYPIANKGWKKKLRRGGGPRYWLLVPGLTNDEVMAADLRIEVPVEKGWLANQERIVGFPSDAEKAALAARLAWLKGRPVFSSEFNRLIINPLDSLLSNEQASGNGDAEEGHLDELVEHTEEVTVSVDSNMHPSFVTITFLGEGELSGPAKEWIREWGDGIRDPAHEAGIELGGIEFSDPNDISARRYQRMTVIWARS